MLEMNCFSVFVRKVELMLVRADQLQSSGLGNQVRSLRSWPSAALLISDSQLVRNWDQQFGFLFLMR